MDELQKFFQRNLRRIAAVGALILSFVAISALLNTAPHTSLWIAKVAVPAGTKISPGEVQLIAASVGSDSHHFESSGDQIIGHYTTRLLQAGDLISTTDLTTSPIRSSLNFLPIGIAVNDLPLDLEVGDHVDIYVIPKDAGTLPAVVVKRVVVQNIDQKARSLGGNVGVSVMADSPTSSLIVTAESQGRLVLARDSF